MTETPMKIKALAPWFGCKRNISAAILELMGPHKSYWEPFCGSMAMLLTKPPCRMETVNDLHGDLINLARVIQDKDLGFQLYDKLTRTLCTEQFFRESKQRWISNVEPYTDQPDIDRACDYFIASWLGMNGVSGTGRSNYQFSMRWTSGGGQGATRWNSVVSSIPAWHKRLRNVLIVSRNAFDIIDNIADEEDLVIYCDPPYFEAGSKYVHHFTGPDHQRLAGSLSRFKNARILVSYYDHPQLDTLYAGWHKIKIKQSRQSLRNAARVPAKSPRKKKSEIILLNQKPGPSNLFGDQ